MPQVSFSIERELIEQLDELAKKWGKSRSTTIATLLRASVPTALGRKPLHEGAEPDLEIRLQDLERRVEKLERLGVKVTFLPGEKEKEAAVE